MDRRKARSEQDVTDFMRGGPGPGAGSDTASRPVQRMAPTAQRLAVGKRADTEHEHIIGRSGRAAPMQLGELSVIQFPLAILIDPLEQLGRRPHV